MKARYGFKRPQSGNGQQHHAARFPERRGGNGWGRLIPAAGCEAQNSGPDPSPQEPLLAQGITQNDPRYYPPVLTGMRGSHPGSFEVAHEMRDDGKWDMTGAEDTGENYDLVVVGARNQRIGRGALFRQERRPRSRACWCSTITTTLAATPSAISLNTTEERMALNGGTLEHRIA